MHIRRGQLSLVAAPGGTGKTALVQSIVQRGDDHGVTLPTLYFSADSDAVTVFQRSAAMATGYELPEVERLMREGGMQMLEERVRSATSHIRWNFKSSLELDDIMDEIEAYAHVYGEYPSIMCFDNISNITSGEPDEFRDLQEVSFFLHDLARDTGAACIALHHVAGSFEDSGKPIPMSGIRGKISKTPELILTLYRASGLNVSVVKNRVGRADPSGGFFVTLNADYARMSFEG